MKKIILFSLLCSISINMHAQDCQSAEAKHNLNRANVALNNIKNEKTSQSYSVAIDEFKKLILLIPDCPDVYKKLFILYSGWQELDNKDSYYRLNAAENFLKVYMAMNPNYEDEGGEQLAKLEMKREWIAYDRKYEDFLDWAYECLKVGNNEFAERYYQLHKFITHDNKRDDFEKYFKMAYLANSHYKKGEYKQAKQIYEEMLKINSYDEYMKRRYDICKYESLTPEEKQALKEAARREETKRGQEKVKGKSQKGHYVWALIDGKYKKIEIPIPYAGP